MIICYSKKEISERIDDYLQQHYAQLNGMPKLVTTNKGTEFKNLAVITYDSFLTGSNRILIRMDSAPTGKKDYNLIAERAVQSLKYNKNA